MSSINNAMGVQVPTKACHDAAIRIFKYLKERYGALKHLSYDNIYYTLLCNPKSTIITDVHKQVIRLLLEPFVLDEKCSMFYVLNIFYQKQKVYTSSSFLLLEGDSYFKMSGLLFSKEDSDIGKEFREKRDQEHFLVERALEKPFKKAIFCLRMIYEEKMPEREALEETLDEKDYHLLVMVYIFHIQRSGRSAMYKYSELSKLEWSNLLNELYKFV